MANHSLWKDEYLFDAYELAREGSTESEIAHTFGIAKVTFLQWEKKRHLLRMSLAMGRALYKERKRTRKKHNSEIAEYVWNSLTPDMKKVWNKLRKADRMRCNRDRMEAILEGHGKYFRQYLFLYAFVHKGFQITKACKAIGISVKCFNKWRDEDPDFIRLFREVQEAEKDFIQRHLHKLIKKGSEAATIFAAKTKLRDRGFAEKTDVNVNVSGQVNHNVLPFDTIKQFLPLETQMQILEAMRKAKEIESQVVPNANQALLPGNVINTEFVEKEIEGKNAV